MNSKAASLFQRLISVDCKWCKPISSQVCKQLGKARVFFFFILNSHHTIWQDREHKKNWIGGFRFRYLYTAHSAYQLLFCILTGGVIIRWKIIVNISYDWQVKLYKKVFSKAVNDQGPCIEALSNTGEKKWYIPNLHAEWSTKWNFSCISLLVQLWSLNNPLKVLIQSTQAQRSLWALGVTLWLYALKLYLG